VGSDAGSLEPGYMPDEPRVFLNPRARATVENAPLRFSTICARNIGQNLNIDKISVTLRRAR
jgi:hypothetical protein